MKTRNVIGATIVGMLMGWPALIGALQVISDVTRYLLAQL